MGNKSAGSFLRDTWATLRGKPASFAPAPHTHSWSQIEDKPTTFVAAWADVTGKPSTFPPAPHGHAWSDITGKPSTFAPSAHTHVKADITDFPTTWAWASLTGVPATFAPSAHVHAIADITNLQTTLNAITAKQNELLGQFNVAESGLTLLALSVRKVNVTVPGAVVGGNYLCFPVNAIPAGFGIVDSICTVAGTLSVGMLVPLITGAYSIPVRVVKVNT